MMKIAIGFLVKDGVPLWPAWQAWLERLEVPFVLHLHAYGDAAPPPGVEVVPQVPTTWGQTMQAHLALLRPALEAGATRHILVSEGCAPCLPPRELVQRLGPEVSWFATRWLGRYNAAGHDARFNARPKSRHRVVHEPYVQSIAWAEQWRHLCRAHMELLVADTAAQAAFADCKVADNEHWPLTTLRHQRRDKEIRTTPPPIFAYWRPGSAHPMTFTSVHQALACHKRYAPQAPILRKLNPNADLTDLIKIITP